MLRPDDFNEGKLPTCSEQAAEWFVRISGGQPSEEERCAFQQWLDADPQNRKEFRAVQDVWMELDDLKDTISSKINNISEFKRDKWTWKPQALAASLALFVLTGVLVLFYHPGSYKTARGELQTVRLADNSAVRLNSDTLLKVEMTEDRRTIRLLRGEAYFEVAHDPDRPFFVVSAGGSTHAVGTQFNVYRKSSDVQVTVVEGRVEVATDNGDIRQLNADETVIYKGDGRAISLVESSKRNALDWLDGRLHFEAMPLTDVVRQLNRYLEKPLYITDPRLNDLSLSGTFHIANLEDLPELLPRLLPVSLKESGDRVLLLPSY